MQKPPTRLTLSDLQQLVDSKQIETVITAFPDNYGRLVGKRFHADFFLDSVAEHGTHACDYLLTVDMEMEPVPGYEFSNWESGYGDFHLGPDFETLRQARWQNKTAIVLCDLEDASHQPIAVAPRSILKRQLDVLAELGLSAMAGSEVEHYVYEQSYRENAESHFAKLKAAGHYIEDYHILQGTREEPLHAAARHHLSRSGIPVESSKGEWGLGQHELNLQYTNMLEMADRHAIYKLCMKELADSLEISVTFMAKPDASQAGSSCHVHVSLWQGDTNAFVGDQPYGPLSCSETFRWFLGGWLKYAPDFMVFYAPNINSYKRYQSASWAPTRLAVAMDNRTAGFRVVGSGNSLRIECRIPGADCNPYLTYAAVLASGIQGIRDREEPPAIFNGNVYDASTVPHVPKTLRDAIDRFRESDVVRSSLGESVQSHFLHFFQTEQGTFDRAVTDWERKRYFERI